MIPVATFLLFLSCGSGIQLWVQAGEWMIPVATFLLSLSCGSGIQLWVGR